MCNNNDDNNGTSAPLHMPTAPAPKQPKTDIAAPEFPKNPTSPANFPKFPGPAPEFSLEGVWQAYANGHQLVMQFQGNNYYLWINGQPAEMGIFQHQGNLLTGTISNTGQPFRNTINFDSTGRSFTLTDPNNATITYQKIQ